MSQTKFTPGPWWVEDNTAKQPEVVTMRDHWGLEDVGSLWAARICGSIGDHTDRRTRGNEQANARLIAAAPLMAEFIRKKADEGDLEAQKIWEAATNA